MAAKTVRITLCLLCLLFATASFLGAGNEIAQQGTPLFQPSFLAAPASCELKGAAGGNCDSDADCPSGSYCYHDPIALVPYCVAGSTGTSFEL